MRARLCLVKKDITLESMETKRQVVQVHSLASLLLVFRAILATTSSNELEQNQIKITYLFYLDCHVIYI